MKKKFRQQKGFSLIEVLLTATLVSFVFAGLLKAFTLSSIQSNAAGNMTEAVAEAEGKIEEIRNHTYEDIAVDYVSGGSPGNTFNLGTLTGKGAVYIDSTNADVLKVKVVVCWKNQDGRIIGEDQDLDGILDNNEDINNNNEIDSMASIETYLSER